jgi:hypothetical protein
MSIERHPLLLGIHGAPQAGKDETFSRVVAWATERWCIATRRRGFADKLKWSLARMFYPNISMEDAIAWCDRLKLDENWRITIEKRDSAALPDVDLAMRDLLRHYGTEAARDIFGDNFWVDQLLPLDENYDAMVSSMVGQPRWHREFMVYPYGVHQDFSPDIDPSAVARMGGHVADVCGITDLRFPNEAERIKQLKGVLVKVRNDEAVQKVIAKAKAEGRELHRSDLELPDDLFDVILDNNNWRTRPEYLGEQVTAMMDERIAA